jgi:hypothetical protein
VPLDKALCKQVEPCKSENCKCFVIPRVAKDVASDVSRLMNSESEHEIFRRANSSSNFVDWLRLGRDVFEAGAGPRKTRI